jgi:hypothetical protein
VSRRPTRRVFLRDSSLVVGAAAGLGLLAGCPEQPEPEPPAGAVALSKQPWVQFTGPTSARLRFETKTERALPVRLTRGDAVVEVSPELHARQLEYDWGVLEVAGLIVDAPGLHVLQTASIEGLAPGERCGWSIDLGEGAIRSGSFVAPAAPGTAFRLGWIADTMRPNTDDAVARLLAEAPDLVLHGGDLQYQTNPFDTWSSLFATLAPLTATAALHVAVGNHEFEGQDEIQVMFDRLLGGQAGAPVDQRYHAFTFGSVRFVCLDSETDGLMAAGSPQLLWLEGELEAVDADPDLLYAIVYFHRPYYTLSQHWQGGTWERDLLHPLFRDHGVPLVLNGHVHSYEHFLVEGVHYVVDGGGGAFLYDPIGSIDNVEAARPGESELQLSSSRSYGVTVVDVAPDGRLSLRRLNARNEETDDLFEILP